MTAPSHPGGTLICCCCWSSGVLPRPGAWRAGGSRSRERERPRVPRQGAGLAPKPPVPIGLGVGEGVCGELGVLWDGWRHPAGPRAPSVPILGTSPHGCEGGEGVLP